MEERDKLNQVNTHVLNAILDAAQDRAVVAARDIYDERGFKLLAQSMPITPALQQRLLELRLKVPLEASLRFESGIDRQQLRQAFVQLIGSDHVLAAPLRPWAREVDLQITSLPLEPVAQFLLTTVQSTKPAAFEHAVQAMALAGVMVVRDGGGPADIRQAMMAGLLHDIGEVYLDPALIGTGDVADLQLYRQLVTHPQLGELLLQGLAHYPLALTQAVAEHHERLDGSGYPRMLHGDKLSSLGRLLAVVEATLGILSMPGQGWARASFALRVIPGEFDGHWMGLVVAAAAQKPARGGPQAEGALEKAWVGLARSSERIESAVGHARQLAQSPSAAVGEAAQVALRLLDRLRTGWNALGLWAATAATGQSAQEVMMADDELRYRLRTLKRNCLWSAAALEGPDADALEPLWASLAD